MIAIAGAGPAGVAAAYELGRRGHAARVFEHDAQIGGLSRTVCHDGYRCDIGGHRFFTKSAEVSQFWRTVLPDDLLRRSRLSRILYRGRLFQYPLRALDALVKLGVSETAHALGSFAKRQIWPRRPERSFEDWVSNRFGDHLYRIFFKTYTEKVWGIACTDLSADWAAQRIRNLNLGRAMLNAIGVARGRNVASLIEEFDYPRYGPGQLYENAAQQATAMGAEFHLRHEIVRVNHDGSRVTSLGVLDGGRLLEVPVSHLISSMPLTDLIGRLAPAPPEMVVQASRALRYRSIITVNLVIHQADVLPDTWVYLHSPEIRAGRLQLYKNWSPYMVPDPATSVVGLEYFTWEESAPWTLSDTALLEMAQQDMAALNLVAPGSVAGGFVVRYSKAYPVYEGDYATRVSAIREYLARFANLVCVGRYGQFRYNNMDHSIMTAFLGVRRLLGEPVDPWAVNEDAQYLEERAPTQA
jgi:protoporphyrinogen oxidase